MSGYNIHIHHYFKDEKEEHKREIPDKAQCAKLLQEVRVHTCLLLSV